MTERKPFGVSWETWIDRQIREGMERGEFDGLPGHGKPIRDVDRPHDELWWVRDKLRREGVSYLPPTLALRKDVEDAGRRSPRPTTEAEVRQIVEEINERIRSVNRLATAGPPSNLMPLDLERTLEEWRAGRRSSTGVRRCPRWAATSGGARRAVSAATMPKITSTAPKSCTPDSTSSSTTQATIAEVTGSAIPRRPVRVAPRLASETSTSP